MMNFAWRRDLVLVGGGHSHALALRMMAMRPDPHTRVTLLSLESHTPYSGMLPGLVAGHYRFEETHIDLRRFCARLGVRFITARAQGIDLDNNALVLDGRPPLRFDVLSLDIGSQPGLDEVPGAAEFATPVKPVHSFYQRWIELEERQPQSGERAGARIVVVGGGAGGVELVLAMRYRDTDQQLHLTLVCGGALLEGYNRGARRAVRTRLRDQGIELLEHARVVEVDAANLSLEDGTGRGYDELFWCTDAVAESWLRDTGLPCDSRGFLEVSDTLQVQGFPHVFAAGDVATQTAHPRPKAGVYAVRQAPVLAHNLRAFCNGEKLRQHRPQRRFLSLLSLGDKIAVADRGPLSASGAWVWRWKHRIDRKFMSKFDSDLPAMAAPPASDDAPMHCGGCGAKLPANMLRECLRQLARDYPGVVDPGQLADDAALVEISPGARLLQSVDVLRSLVDDPWLMGRVAVLHALSDLYAMGAVPHSALASLTIPYAGPRLQQADLQQLMAGVVEELQAAGCRLLGGHTLEGQELSLGITVNGEVTGATLEKQGVQPGDQLVLCKPLGTGVLFAAQQQGRADGRWISRALETMLQSNAVSAELASQHGVRAATDITGFGLLGHLAEMLQGAQYSARIELASVPLLPGTRECFAAGMASTLQPGNIAAVQDLLDVPPQFNDAHLQALFDPQTSGGLLLAVAAAGAQELVAALRESGYGDAAVIGAISAGAAKAQIRIA